MTNECCENYIQQTYHMNTFHLLQILAIKIKLILPTQSLECQLSVREKFIVIYANLFEYVYLHT